MKKFISLLIIAFVLIVAAITNPSKADYITYLKDKKIEQSENNFEKGVISIFAPKVFDSASTSKDYIFFSIHSTEYDISKTRITYLGIFKKFILINGERIEDVKAL